MAQITVEVSAYDRANFPSDGRVVVYGNYRLSNSYGPVNETLDARELGLTSIEFIAFSPAVDAGSPSLSLLPVPLDRAPVTQARVFVPSATPGQDLSAYTGRFLAIGF